MTTMGLFIFGYFAALFFFWRGLKKEGFPSRTAFDLFFLTTFGFFFLGRLTFLLFGGETVLPNLFFFWRGILPVWGLIGAFVLFWDFVHRGKLSFYRVSDYFSSALSLLLTVYLFGVGSFIFGGVLGISFLFSFLFLSRVYSLPTWINSFFGGFVLFFSSAPFIGIGLMASSFLGLVLFMIRKLGRRG